MNCISIANGWGWSTHGADAEYIYKNNALKKYVTHSPLSAYPMVDFLLIAFIRYDALTWGSRHSQLFNYLMAWLPYGRDYTIRANNYVKLFLLTVSI